jgi:competence protein ComEA
LYCQLIDVRWPPTGNRHEASHKQYKDREGGLMKRKSMAVLTIVTVALLMSWVVPALSADLQKVNINTAALEELMTLDGIGPAVAERILAFRDKNGPFQKPEDLMRVKGIGQIMFDKNSARIIVKDK